jgi:7-carboxy-7-deazaguanine synthase
MQKTLRITEIYHSIQGESTWAGLPCTFIRLARCNLRCTWCDTAYSFHGGTSTPLDDILTQCKTYDCSLVEITGGEPLAQRECIDLAQALIAEGYTVLIETSGSLPIAPLPAEVIKIMDLKCPGSGECAKNDYSNIDELSPLDEVKFVITNREDYDWAKEQVEKYDLIARCNAVLFSPVFSIIDPKDIVNWITEDALQVRFQLQMHKFIWPPDQKGV